MDNYNVHEDMAEYLDEVVRIDTAGVQFACDCSACLAGEFDDCQNGWS